jgi:sulfite reductase (NADPH) flavoprotein alpha-component
MSLSVTSSPPPATAIPRPAAGLPAVVPVLPESAPFTAEQRAYLNGFLAGLFSYAPIPAPPSVAPTGATASPPLRTLTILFASQTGTSEKLARRIAKTAGGRGFAPTLHDLARYPREQLATESSVLLVASTYGDGEPPDAARAFWQWLESPAAPKLPNLRFSVCALGDSNYPRFCAFGKSLDARLEALGARRIHARVDCDTDHEPVFAAWLGESLRELGSTDNAASSPAITSTRSATATVSVPDATESTGPSREQPFPARLKSQHLLTAPGSGKDVRHFTLDLAGSDLRYQVGDALGVWPSNCPDLVDAVLGALGCRGHEEVPLPEGGCAPFRDALLGTFELTRIPKPLLQLYATRTGDPQLAKLTAPNVNGDLTEYLRGRDVLDLLQAHPEARPEPADFVRLLRRLQPRLYSISSSPRVTPNEVHLTVSIVRYESQGRARKGVASTFLAERCEPGVRVPIYVHENPAFRPPAPDRPLIMVGPGTGIAPFRGFLLDRRATGAQGKNWLFFGDRNAATDFLYREEIETFQRDGSLHRLDLAWSRDRDAKVYVQQRMLESASTLWSWLEEGACFYVCGDASRMAKDVDAALHQVIQQAGARTPDQAAQYVDHLRATGRYCRDVY